MTWMEWSLCSALAERTAGGFSMLHVQFFFPSPDPPLQIPSPAMNMETLTDRIGALFTAQCAHEDNHNCIIVWSSGAEEQIEAIISGSVPEWASLMAERQETVEHKWAADTKCMLGFAQILKENGLMPSSKELIEAYNRFLASKP